MKEFEFYKELYFKEFERKNTLENSLSLPIAIITALYSAIFYLATTFDYNISDKMNVTFVIIISISALLELIAIFYLIKSFNNLTSGFPYTYIPYPNELRTYHTELKEYYNQIDDGGNNANSHFLDYLTDNLANHVDNNAYLNDIKSSYLHQSKRFIVICLIFSLIGLSIYGLNYFRKDKEIQKIEIINKDHKQNKVFDNE